MKSNAQLTFNDLKSIWWNFCLPSASVQMELASCSSVNSDPNSLVAKWAAVLGGYVSTASTMLNGQGQPVKLAV